MYGSLDISTSGLIAQRTRLTVATANIANADSILNAQGQYEPYRRRYVVFEPADAPGGAPGDLPGGVKATVRIDQGPLRPAWEPGSPYADAEGYVYYPRVDPVIEQMNAVEATRAYEANISAIEATKSMISVALQTLA